MSDLYTVIEQETCSTCDTEIKVSCSSAKTGVVLDPSSRQKISDIDDSIMTETVGLSQAVAKIRGGLDRVDYIVQCRKFDQLSDIGYRALGSDLIWFQRILGSFQNYLSLKESLISRLAFEHRKNYEEVQPVVESIMNCYKPKPESSDQIFLNWKDIAATSWQGKIHDVCEPSAIINLMEDGLYFWEAMLTNKSWTASGFTAEIETAKTCAQKALYRLRKLQAEVDVIS
jgi:hypothetical protein